jgi:2-polyprenyl-3-methyl-5-hydroxy-6-metoxy-1,4-benzoquinol methylase
MAMRPCWCGNEALEPFTDDYRVCRRCDTLVSTFEHATDVSRVTAEESDLYGRNYWFGHMEKDLGFTNIYDRARSDLTDRCLFWLATLLRYRTPPGRTLELGCAHGGFVATLQWAGFTASGLELSPAIAQIARDLFQVDVLEGAVEDQHPAPGTCDVIVMMDVLEHLPNPAGTLRCCVERLKPDGLLLIQTPKFPEGASFQSLRAQDSRFVEMLKPQEHLYLFSASSVVQLVAQAGCPYVSFEPALFAHYDMCLVVSRVPPAAVSAADSASALATTPAGPLVSAALELYQRVRLEQERFAQADDDRTRRLVAIETLTRQLQESEADRAARLEVIQAAQARIEKLTARRRRKKVQEPR